MPAVRPLFAVTWVASAAAFAPAAVRSPYAAAVNQPAALPMARPLPTAQRRLPTGEASMFLSIPKVLVSIPTLYALMSVNEYATHRWYQHEEFNRDHKFNRLFQHLALWLKKRPLYKQGGRRNGAASTRRRRADRVRACLVPADEGKDAGDGNEHPRL